METIDSETPTMELSRRFRLEKLKGDGELECPICMRRMFELHHDLTSQNAALQRDPIARYTTGHHPTVPGPTPAQILDSEHVEPGTSHAVPVQVAFRTATGILGVTSSLAPDALQRANASWCHSPTTLRICRHTFCAACISAWLHTCHRNGALPTCPTCRAALNPNHPRLRLQARRERELNRYAATYARAVAAGTLVPFTPAVAQCGAAVSAALAELSRTDADIEAYASAEFLALLQHWSGAVRGALAAARAMRGGGGGGGGGGEDPVRMSPSRVCDLIFFNMVDEDARRWGRERGLTGLPEVKGELRRMGVHRERLEYHFAARESAEFGKFAQMAVGCAILRDRGDQETGGPEGFHGTYGYGHGGFA